VGNVTLIYAPQHRTPPARADPLWAFCRSEARSRVEVTSSGGIRQTLVTPTR